MSIATASRIINRVGIDRFAPDTRRRVTAAAQELGYTVNYHGRAMRTGRSQTVGIAFDVYNEDQESEVDGNNFLAIPYFACIVAGAEAYLRHKNYRLMLIGADTEDRAPEHGVNGLRQGRLDGLIVLGHVVKPHDQDIFTTAPKAPIVVLGCDRPTLLPVIEIDQAKAMSLIAEHLHALGHRSVVYLVEQFATQRVEFLRQALDARGMKLIKVEYPRLVYRDADTIAQEALARYLARTARPPTAVVAYNDHTAVGGIRAILSHGLSVPTDVSVVGFDNTTASLCIPGLTTVDHRLGELGQLAARRTLEFFEDPELIAKHGGCRELLEPTLLVRQSIARAKQTADARL